MSQFNPLNDFLLYLLRLIEHVRQKYMEQSFRKKIANVKSEFFFIQPNGLGTFDIKNMHMGELRELNAICNYLIEYGHYYSPLLYVITQITNEFLWPNNKEERK